MNKKLLEEKLKIKVGEDTYQQLDNVLSSIFNCENLIGEQILQQLFSVIEIGECDKFYFIILSFLERVMQTRTVARAKTLRVSEELWKQYLTVNINKLISNDDVNLPGICEEVQEDLNLTIPEGQVRAKQILYSYCMRKYREIRDMNIDITTGTLFLDTLHSSIQNDYSLQGLRLSSIVMDSGLTVGNEMLYQSSGYILLNNYINQKLMLKEQLWKLNSTSVTKLGSIEDYNNYMATDNSKIYETCIYGFPPIDKYAHVNNKDIINLTAMEGTGKTTYCCAFACRELLNGFNVIFMTGESEKTKIIHMILSHMIWLKTQDIGGYQIDWKEIAFNYNELPQEWKAVINECRYDLFENKAYGDLILEDQFSYNNIKQEVIDIIESYPEDTRWGHLIIDHTNALRLDNSIAGGLFLKDRWSGVREMFAQLKELKKEKGMGSLTTSHLKTELEKDLIKGKDIGTRIGAGSGATSTDVDVMLFFFRTENLKKKNLVQIEVKKFREVKDNVFTPFVCRRQFRSCVFEYDESLQTMLEGQGSELSVDDLDLTEIIE